MKRGRSTSGRITAWSFSRWRDYDTCPRKARYKHIDRLPDPGGEALDRGIMVHELAQRYVDRDARLRSLPAPLKNFRTEFAALRESADTATEEEWAFTEALEPTKWMARNAWLRCKVDLRELLDGAVVRIVDYKTGRPHPREDQLQLKLYGLAALAYYEDVEEVQTELWFLDQPSADGVEELVFEAADLGPLEEEWRELVAPMLADRTFEPRPGRHCSWCPFSKAKRGPCPY